MSQVTPKDQACAVYILAEDAHFKIGISVSVADRAKQVTPQVHWEQSHVLTFLSVKEARGCERTLHYLFRDKRIPPLERDGGTEFFALDCLPSIVEFITTNKATLGYQEIRSGAELEQEHRRPKKGRAKKPQKPKPFWLLKALTRDVLGWISNWIDIRAAFIRAGVPSEIVQTEILEWFEHDYIPNELYRAFVEAKPQELEPIVWEIFSRWFRYSFGYEQITPTSLPAEECDGGRDTDSTI